MNIAPPAGNAGTPSPSLLDRHWYALPLAALVSWVFLYWSYFPMLAWRWDNEDYSYCFLVPVVFVWLVYEARKTIAQSLGSSPWLGYVILPLGAFLYLAGKLGSLETFVYMSMWLNLAALVGITCGTRVLLRLWFPFLILLFAIPAPPFATQIISLQLKLVSSYTAAQLLHFLQVPVFVDGNFIDLGAIQLQVVDACSGLRYLVPTILLALLMGSFFLRRAWTRIFIFLLSPGIAILSNSIRIAITGLLVKYISPVLAEGFFHDFSGWLVYVITIAFMGLIILGLRRLETPKPKQELAAPTVSPGNKRPWFGLGVVLVCFAALYLTQTLLFHNQVIPDRTSFASFPNDIQDWKGTRITLDQEVLDSLWANDYLYLSMRNGQTANQLSLLVPYYSRQTTKHTAHAPTSCLLGGGWGLQGKQLLAADPNGPRNFPVTQMIMTKGPRRIISIFWFEQRGRHITNEYINKIMLFWDAIFKNRTDGALVRVEMLLEPGQSVAQGQQLLDPFLREVKDKLPAYVPN